MKKLFPLALIVLFFKINATSQVDSLATEQVDSISTEQVAVQDTLTDDAPSEKEHKRVSDFKVYAGLSTSTLLLSDDALGSAYATGFLLGFAYRKGRFSYWETGLNYNNSVVTLEELNVEEDMEIQQLELPISAGINLLSATRRVIGVRLFGGLVPGYILSVGDNTFDLTEDDFNRFQLGGRFGVGVDALFLFLEVGYQYGFSDVLKGRTSNSSQFDLKLGFRF